MIISHFIIQANVITIVNYDRKTFIVQAIGWWDIHRNIIYRECSLELVHILAAKTMAL
jgi:hypothetical protein